MLFLLIVLLVPVNWTSVEPRGISYFDKLAHVGMFGVTGFIAVFFTDFWSRLRNRVALALAGGLVFGAGIEFAQHFIPHRTMDGYDLLADVVGLGLGVLFFSLLYRYRLVR